MPLTDPVETRPNDRTRDDGNGSIHELKLYGDQSGADWAIADNLVRTGDEPAIGAHVREDETVYVLEAGTAR